MSDLEAFLFLAIWVVLVGCAFSLIIQGWVISSEKGGYTNRPDRKRHPEIDELEGDTGVLMVAKISGPRPELPPDDEEDESYKLLRDRINRQKMEELFDEPSSFEDDNDDPDC